MRSFTIGNQNVIFRGYRCGISPGCSIEIPIADVLAAAAQCKPVEPAELTFRAEGGLKPGDPVAVCRVGAIAEAEARGAEAERATVHRGLDVLGVPGERSQYSIGDRVNRAIQEALNTPRPVPPPSPDAIRAAELAILNKVHDKLDRAGVLPLPSPLTRGSDLSRGSVSMRATRAVELAGHLAQAEKSALHNEMQKLRNQVETLQRENSNLRIKNGTLEDAKPYEPGDRVANCRCAVVPLCPCPLCEERRARSVTAR